MQVAAQFVYDVTILVLCLNHQTLSLGGWSRINHPWYLNLNLTFGSNGLRQAERQLTLLAANQFYTF